MKRGRIDWRSLHAAAQEAIKSAYAPYSHYPVAAALCSDAGQIFTGVNVENASYGLSLCAERNAVTVAVGAGVRSFSALLVLVPAALPASPCGACRQVLREFAPSFPVRSYAARGRVLRTSTGALLPASFGPENLAAAAPPVRRRRS
jgi:cytidine deaminase